MEELPSDFKGTVQIAIIGGTGISSLPSFKPVARLPLSHPALQTPWGKPSSPITILSHPRPRSGPSSAADGDDFNVAFLSRHGLKHEIAAHEVNSRANIAALRRLGVRCVVAFSAVGSLRGEFKPRDFLVPDQVFDRTKGIRPFTFFEKGVVAHVNFAEPFDDALRQVIFEAIDGKGVLQGEDVKIHEKGMLICMEGPQFSTRAESQLYRMFGGTVINMSCLPEAKLAREAELAYAMVCMSTDYDSWKPADGELSGESVTVEMVMGHMRANAENAKRVVAAVLDALLDDDHDQATDRSDIVAAKKWEGSARAALTGLTQDPELKKDALARLEFLFPGRSHE